MRTRFELAHVVKCFGDDLIISGKLSPLQSKVLGKIATCRTAFLGGHQEACDNCGTIRYSYNSCGDRHCPKCQAAKQAFWIDELVQSTLPVKHYHIVFTMPHQLHELCLHNTRMFYDLLFAAVWHTNKYIESGGCSSTPTHRWVVPTAQSPIYYHTFFFQFSIFFNFSIKIFFLSIINLSKFSNE